jgi:outer membrane protein TolC
MTLRKRVLIALMLLQTLLAGTSFASARLTLEDCIKTALEKHPDLVAAKSKVDSAKANVGEALSGGRPQLSAGTGYSRSGSSDTDSDVGTYNTNVAVEQSIYDWGRRELSVSGAMLSASAAEMDYMEVRDQIIADVRDSYYALSKSVRDNKIAKTRYSNYEKRLNWARSYYEAGTKAKIEVTKAESDLANAKLILVKSVSAIEQSKAALASAMGVPMLEISEISDELAYADWNIKIEDAVKRAAENRPELTAQSKRVESAKANLELQKKGLMPDMTGSAGYSLYGSAPADTGEWTAKVSVSIPISDGGLTKSKVMGAAADLAQADAEMKSLYNSVVLEVRKAYESLVEAKESFAASREAERQAKETLDLALERYRAGVGSSLEISDAVESFASAQTNTVQSLYDCKKARLDLEKAIGGLN